MSLKLPNDKIVYNLPEQVGVNAENIKYLAEVYKEIDSIPAQYADLKEDYDTNIKAYFDDTMKPTFSSWTNTFNGWTNTLDTYLTNMSSAALGAIANGTVSGNLEVSGNFTAGSIIQKMNYGATGNYRFTSANTQEWTPIYVGIVQNGNKITFVIYGKISKTSYFTGTGLKLGAFLVPASVGNSLYPDANQNLDYRKVNFFTGATDPNPESRTMQAQKTAAQTFDVFIRDFDDFTIGEERVFRYEITFLLSQNLAS